MKTSKYWEKRSINRLLDSEKQSEWYIKKIEDIYKQANKNIIRDIENIWNNYSKNVGLDKEELKIKLTKRDTSKIWNELHEKGLDKYIKNNYKSRITRLEQLQTQLYEKVKNIFKDEKELQELSHRNTFINNYNKTIYDTQIGTGYDFDFNKIDEITLNAILNEKWTGKNFSERIWDNTDKLADELVTIIGGAVLSGQGIEKTTSQIRKTFNTSRYNARRLAINETLHFHHEAEFKAYEEMGIEQYIYSATLDLKTCVHCQPLDMKIFSVKDRIEGVNAPQMHVNCRCAELPYVNEEVTKNLKRRARNPITGKTEIIDNMSYSEWVNKYGLGSNDKVYTKTNHPKPKLLENIDFKDNKEINRIISNYEKIIKDDIMENAIVITKAGEVYQCFGNSNRVWVDIDLGNKLNGAIVTHNHPNKETYFGFSQDDINLFEDYKLSRLRGIDYKYIYEFDRNKHTVLSFPEDYMFKEYGFEHLNAIAYAIENNIYYNRWKNNE